MIIGMKAIAGSNIFNAGLIFLSIRFIYLYKLIVNKNAKALYQYNLYMYINTMNVIRDLPFYLIFSSAKIIYLAV